MKYGATYNGRLTKKNLKHVTVDMNNYIYMIFRNKKYKWKLKNGVSAYLKMLIDSYTVCSNVNASSTVLNGMLGHWKQF